MKKLLIVAALLCAALCTSFSLNPETDYMIYTDEDRNITLYSNDNGLFLSVDGESHVIEPGLVIKKNNYGYYYQDYFSAELSPNKNIICFYGENGETYLLNIANKTVNRFPVDNAKIYFDANGSTPEFYSTIIIIREGMSAHHRFLRGLYRIKGEKLLIGENYNISFYKYDGVTAKFIIKEITDFYTAPVGMVYWYNTKTNYSGFEEYLPEYDKSYKDIPVKTLRFSDLSLFNVSRYDGGINTPEIWVSGSFVIARYNNGFARYNLKNKKKTAVPVPITVIGDTLFYLEKAYVSGPVYRMNIHNLLPQWTSIGYAGSYGIWQGGSNINFLNTIVDKEGSFKDIPYSLNTKTGVFGKITEEQYNAKYYRVFDACNGRKLCTYMGYAYLYDAGSMLVRKLSCSQTVYINGYLYTVGTDKDKHSVIEKYDLNGKYHGIIYRTYSPHASINSLTCAGNRIYFIAGGNMNLYGVDTNGKNLIKY
ncbi:MAG: hypothetical protein GX541_07820 [Clostridiales bacterium]|nr:hypothetical protein [Clostridiales bacterium]